MAFTTPAAGNAMLAATWNEVESARVERAQVITPDGVYGRTVAAGQIFSAATAAEKQQWVKDSLGYFVVSHAGGSAHASGHYQDATSIPHYADLAAVFSAAGLGYSNWRRYTVHPDDGGTVQYGQAQPGDIIGQWILEDLQAVMLVLVWVAPSPSGTEGGIYGTAPGGAGRYSDANSGDQGTWADAKAAALAGYADAGGAFQLWAF